MSKLRDLLGAMPVQTTMQATVPTTVPAVVRPSSLLAIAQASKQQLQHAAHAEQRAQHAQHAPAIDLLDMQAVGSLVLDCTTDPADWPKQLIVEKQDELPEKLQSLLAALQAALGTDDIDTVLTQTAGFIAANPGTADILLPQNIQLIVRACRIAHGTVIARKTEQRTTRTTKKQATLDLANELSALGFRI